MVLKMLTKLRRRMDIQSENFNDIKNIGKYQIEVTELKKIIIELKNTIVD